MPAARSWRGWIFWLIRSSQESLVGLLDPLTVVDVRGDEVCDLYAADPALMRPDQVVARRGGDVREAWPIPDALTLRKSVRHTSQ